jgi:hypothetical protein
VDGTCMRPCVIDMGSPPVGACSGLWAEAGADMNTSDTVWVGRVPLNLIG